MLKNAGLEVELDSSYKETKERLWVVRRDGSPLGAFLEQTEQGYTCVMIGARLKDDYQILRKHLISIGAEDLSEVYYNDPKRRGLCFRIGRWLYKRYWGWDES